MALLTELYLEGWRCIGIFFEKSMHLEHILWRLGNLDTPFFRLDLAKMGKIVLFEGLKIRIFRLKWENN